MRCRKELRRARNCTSWKLQRASAILLCVSFYLGAPLGSANAAPPDNAPDGARPSAPHASSFTRLAQLVGELPLTTPSLVVVAPVASGPLNSQKKGSPALSVEASLTLHTQIVAVVGSAVTEARLRSPKALSLSQARLEARRHNLALVYLSPHLVGGFLVLDVNVVQWPRQFWQRSLIPEGTTTQHASFRVPGDATIRRHLPPAPGLFTTRKKFQSPLSEPVALGCGDMNGDGGSELLIVSRGKLALGRFGASQFTVESTNHWSQLSPIATAPLRSPLGAVRIEQNQALVGLSDRREMLWLNSNLKPSQSAPRGYPVGGGQCVAFTSTGLEQDVYRCTDGPPATTNQLPRGTASSIDALALGSVTEINGTLTKFTAQVPQASSTARIESIPTAAQRKRAALANIGSVLAWADLDGNGTIELISSLPADAGSKDALVVHSYIQDEWKQVVSLKAGPVHAITICPFSGINPLYVVAAIGKQLWVLH